MTTAATRLPAIRKELRALLPAWIAAVFAILLTADRGFSAAGLAMVTYLLSACVVGAWAIGHDIHAGTLALFLAQPRSRRDMWLTKMAVLVPVQLSLGAVELGPRVLLMSADVLAGFAIPLLAGLFIAPWLTVVSRRALAGAVFAAIIPMGWFLVGDLAQALPFDVDPGWLAWLVFVGGSYLVALVGAVAGWRAFTRLEVIDGSAGEFLTPRTAAVAEPHRPTVKRSVIWLLVRKDLRLLTLPVAVAAVFIIAALVLSVAERRQDWLTRELYAFTPLYIGLNALLIGAMSSAEERQLGTADWQVMLPMATSVQWVIKVAVTLAIAAVLTMAVPVLVLSLIPAGRTLVTEYATTFAGFLIAAFVLTGVYVSSLCRTSLGAFLASLPSVAGAWTLAAYAGIGTVLPGHRFLLGFQGRWWSKLFVTLAPTGLSESVRTGFVHAVPPIGAVALAVPFVVAVYFAMRNHRSAERGSRRIAWQVLWMFVFMSIAGTAYLGASVGSAWTSRASNRERRQVAIDGIASHASGQVGICVLSSRFGIASANEDQAFPMGDAWRLTVADAAFGAVDARSLPLDEPLTDLLRRSIVDRDAAAASGLVARVGGPTEVNRLEWKRFVGHTHFVGDGNPANTTTPYDIAERLYVLAMRGSRTPSSKLFMDLVREMPPDVELTAGRPGWTAWRLTAGPHGQKSMTDATTDVALVITPDKALMTVSVLVADSHASSAERSALLASVMRAIIDTY